LTLDEGSVLSITDNATLRLLSIGLSASQRLCCQVNCDLKIAKLWFPYTFDHKWIFNIFTLLLRQIFCRWHI